MPNGASIVVDIKAQITGYQELIEKIKAELKKIDPGSNIGKGLNKTLALAETKLALLSRNAEKRITSEGLLEHLFDLLHMVNDLMRNLGQGMSNVGLNDVLETASEKAKELGNSLREVKTEMAQKGNTFFEDLKKTNPKELLAVFDELKFDPKTMGIDTFVESFKLATESAKTEVEDLKNKLREAQAELERTSSMKARRDLLPVALLGTKVAQEAIRNTFGARNNLDAAKIVSDRDAEILTFVDKIKAGIESDTTRSDANKENAVNALSESITKLLDAKTDELVKKILSDLDRALKSTKGEDKGGSHSGIKGLSGESLNTELILKLSLTTYLADQDFVNKIQEVVKLLNDSSNSGANGAGARISEILNALLLPTDVATFNDNMNALIRSLQEGLLKVNKASGDFDTTAKSNVVKTTEEALEAAKLRASNLETVAKSLAYSNLEQEYRALSQRLSDIELALGLERNSNRAGVAGDIKNTGKGVLDHAAQANNDAINSLKQYGSMLEDVLARLQMVGKVEGIAQRWFSVYAAVRMVSKAFLSMKLTITNLDKTITEIAIVTDMSLSDLWKLMPEYTNIARKYGASLEGVYLVSQLYYQQGLEQADVMALTEETLKMARISGLGYSEATDYMTNAIRSFKIEMLDAGRVVDVYSALAATSASSTTELATAMSKTASSAAAVGSSFEATATMMAVMIETTRESPENIGSALKSIISRYGELKENKTGIDEEGEEYSLNKVDTALLSVGISIHDAQGQFRDFDDTIMELAKSWDTIDTNTLRYIATVMAGNRQQSRFLALVSNGARLAEEMEVANNSEDAATLLMLKTMDSIDYKSQLLLTSLLSLYTSTGVENMFKGILDGANLIVETFTLMPTVFLLPIPAIASLATNFISMANIVMTTIHAIKQKFMAQYAIDNATLRALNLASGTNEIADTAAAQQAQTRIVQEESAKRRSILAGELSGLAKMNIKSKAALGAQLAGTVLNLGAGLISDKGEGNRRLKAGLGIGGSALQYGALGFLLTGNYKGAIAGAILGGLMGAWQNISYIWESTAAQAKRLKEEAEEAATDAKIKLSLANSAEKEIANLKKLEAERYKSAEANLKYIEAANKAAEDMPDLVSHFDNEGNAILNLGNAYEVLAEKRKAANESGNEAAKKSGEAALKATQEAQEKYSETIEWSVGSTFMPHYDELINAAEKYGFYGAEVFMQLGNYGDEALPYLASGLLDIGYFDNANSTLEQVLKDQNNIQSKSLLTLLSNVREGNFKEIYDSLVKDDSIIADWNEAIKALNLEDNDPGKILLDWIVSDITNSLSEIKKLSGDVSKAQSKEASTYRREISSAMKGQFLLNFLDAEYGKDKDALLILTRLDGITDVNEMATEMVLEQWKKQAEGKSGDELNTAWKNFMDSLEKDDDSNPLNAVYEILENIPDTALDSINKLYSNKSNLTEKLFHKQLQDILPEKSEDFYNALAKYYLNAFADWDTVLASDSWKDYEFRPLISSKTKDEFGPEEQRRILNQYEGLNKLYNQGKITHTDANQISTNYSSILRYSATLDDNNKEIVQKILTNTDFTLESLTDAINQILNNTDLTEGEKLTIIPKLTAILSAIPVNINTTIETYLDEYAEKTENLSKDLSKATKGMTQKDALKMADDLKIDTSTKYFDVKKGKLFLKDTNLLYNSYFGEDSSLNKLNEKISQLKEELKKIKDPTTLTESKFDHISAKEVTSINKAWADWSKTNGENWQAFIEYYFTGRINEVKLLSEDLMNSIRLESAIDNGDLEEITKAAMTGTAKDIPKFLITPISKILTVLLLQGLQSGDFTNLINNNLLSQEFKEQLPVMKDAYDQANSTILTGLTNNIGAGIEYIEANDYNRNLLSDMAKSGLAELNKDASGEIIGATINNTIDDIDTIYNFIKNYTTPDGFDKTEILAKLKLQQYTTRTKSGTLAEIVKNTDAISATAVESFKAVWGDTAEIRALFQDNGNGTYKATENLLVWIQNHLEELNDSANTAALEMLALIFDNNLSSIKNAVSYVTSGAKNLSEIKKLITTAKNVGVTIDQSNFSFDAIANAWTLDSTKMLEFVRALGLALINAGLMTLEQFGEYLQVNVTLALASAVDIDSFLQAENRGELSLARAQLSKLLDSLLSAIAITPYETIVNEVKDEWYATHDTITQENQKEIKQKVKQLWDKEVKAKQEYAQLREMSNEEIIADLENGGARAVELAQLIAKVSGKELSLEQIDSYYYAQINRLLGFADSISNLTKGSYVAEGEFRKILSDADVGMVDSNGVVTSVERAAAAYKKIYDKMGETGEQTESSLNKVYALYLTETERGDIDAIEVMGNAMGMTYDALGELLGRYGENLENWLNNNTGLYEKIGAGKIRITDFSQFASDMGWQPGSEEYTSAFKAYNDSLIEYNRQTEKSIVEEIKNVSTAKAGDKINLTNFASKLEYGLDTIVKLEGAKLVDGILEISDNANIANIVLLLKDIALSSVELLPSEIAELTDAISEILKQITSLITSGINGSLSNVNKHELEAWAQLLNLNNLHFTETADGYLLAYESAIRVYNVIKNIDALQGKIVFDELKKNLIESDERFKTIESLMQYILTLREKTQSTDKYSSEKIKLYKEELLVAERILAVRSAAEEDDSFNFMSREIPVALNNPLNWFSNWQEGYQALTASRKSGYMDYKQFYRLFTEIGNLASESNPIKIGANKFLTNMLDVQNLIELAAGTLKINAATGKLEVSFKELAKLGIDFGAAGGEMDKNVTTGMLTFARAQVNMLDGLIKMLETIVLMEDLKNIGDGDNTLDLSEVFPNIKVDSEDLHVSDDVQQLVAKYLNPESGKYISWLNDVKLGNETLAQLFTLARDDAFKTQEEAKKFYAVIKSFHDMNVSLDWTGGEDTLAEMARYFNDNGIVNQELTWGDQTIMVGENEIIPSIVNERGEKEYKWTTKDGTEKTGTATEYYTSRKVDTLKTLQENADRGKVELSQNGTQASIQLLDNLPISVSIDKNGKFEYNGLTYDTLDLIFKAYLGDEGINSGNETIKTVELLKIAAGLTIVPTIDLKPTLTAALLKALRGKTAKELQNEFANKPIESQATYGIKVDENTSEADLLAWLNSLDEKVTLNANIDPLVKTVNELKLPDKYINIYGVYKGEINGAPSGGKTSDTSLSKPRVEKSFVYNSTGNIGLAQAKGTLMGELGPELVVSNGRYFVAGQNGPEMVDLANDAIVFNHLQTKSLLEKGTSPGRGKAITNERNAVAFATGNINGGPAMASASAALAALRLLRAEWNAIAQLSVQDLAGKGGGGGGGGGGDSKSFIKDLERWYNWLQQIALLEKEINLEEAKRSRYLSSMISMGREYADSQLVTIDKLKQQIAVLESLNRSQEAYFEKRRKELNENSAFKALYQFDENGQLKYKPGQFEWLSNLVGRDSVTGEANYTAKEQYDMLVAAGYGELMKYDSSGAEIKQDGDNWLVTAVQAFWDKIEAERQEMQSLHDDVLEGQVKEEELMTNLNEILNAIEDNLIAVEDKVLKAVEEIHQRMIDDVQDLRDAIEESSKSLLDGLSDLLSKEQDMYSRQQDSNELSTLQRRLSILLRSGGSASEIANLLKEINAKQKDAYFEAQLLEIDALLDAVDAQLEKLDKQIELMTETLEYEKLNGLLWGEVYEVMNRTPEEITSFITTNTEEYWGKSPTDLAEDTRDVLFLAELFVLLREKVEGGLAALIEGNSPEAIAEESKKITAESEAALAAAEKTASTNTNTTSATNTATNNTANKSNNNNNYKYVKKASVDYNTADGVKTATAWGWSNKSEAEASDMALKRAILIAAHSNGYLSTAGNYKYDRGGMVEQDGPAFLHAKESVLTPQQTSILRNDILSNKPTSLLSLLTDFRDAYENLPGASAYNTTNNDGVVIQQATVEMHVNRIANDYDAQRAGELALDQMLAIARKTLAQNRVGR